MIHDRLRSPSLAAAFVTPLLAALLTLVPVEADAAPCGGHLQRACCIGEGSARCNANHIEVAGCSGDCLCNGTGPFSSSSHCILVTACGGNGQRACCLGEGSGRCGAGLTEVPGCSGNCFCAGGLASSSSSCRQTTHCGSAGERACCVGETINGGNGGGCRAGTFEVAGCTGVGDCTCGGGTLGAQSSSRCVATTACGGAGQRACCVGERTGGACNPGLTEVPGCGASGDACRCAGSSGASSSSRCVQTTACGGPNQRACCIGETLNGGNGGGCDPGLAEISGCSGVGDCTCGGGTSGSQSSSRCVAVSACGGEGQRACCVGERAAGACDAGLTEVPGCPGGNCLCAGSTGASSSSRCVQTTACGGANQRACCTGETLNGGNGGGCDPGLGEVAGCTGVGECTCGGGVSGSQSSSRCVAVAPCGAEGQRACCIGEGTTGSCRGGLTEVPGCTGNCVCADGVLGAASSGTCTATTPCGGAGQRACCAGETGFGACHDGLTEVSGCDGNCFCKGGALGTKSSGTCVVTTRCGGEGERACCIGETSNGGNGGGCDDGLIEVSGCADDCACAGGFLGAESSGTCQKRLPAAPCGGEGQRACCAGEGQNCGPGLIEVAGCSGNCLCGGDNPLNFGSSGTCHRPSPCGGEGQRACCFAERLPSCDDAHVQTPGCAGDCFCGGSATGVVDDDALGMSGGTCVRSPVKTIGEPEVGLIAASTKQCSQAGYADLHMHLFADIAHGGGVLAGHPCPRNSDTFCPEAFNGVLAPGGCSRSYCDDSLDVNSALRACYGTYLDMVTKSDDPLPTPSCPSWLPNCGNKLFHGDHTLFDDAVGAVGTLDGSGDSQMGAPAFSGWPQWSSTTHQQAYYKWLERAWRGGLRLIVQMAVTNTALCVTNKHLSGVDCDDSMAFIDQQLQAAYDFEAFIDRKVGGGTDADEGWFRIVKTPAEAREVLAEGKLAVVLGIEVDHPFNCSFPKEQCTRGPNDTLDTCTFTLDTSACKDPANPALSSAEYVRAQVDRYYDTWGVRHMFPVHNFDNAFGGAATWQDTIEVGNRWVEGHWYKSRDCSAEGYSYKLGSEGTSIQAITSLFGFGELSTVPFHPEAASCNAFGLFPLGEVLVEQMMQRGMIIDVDHMSSRAFDDTVKLAQKFRDGGYPLAASHALFMDLHIPSIRHERMRTAAQVAQLKSMGGMVGVMLKDDTLDRGSRGERSTNDYAGSGIVDDCRHSSKTFAQALALAVDQVGAAGMGSDFDGVAGHFAPRFGSDACGGHAGERSTQLRAGARLAYPFTLEPFGTFGNNVSGTRTFDYNVDGLAHMGLLPDFVSDLAVVGMKEEHLDPLLRSADAYIRMWERAEGKPAASTCLCVDEDGDGKEDCVTDQPGTDGGIPGTSEDGGGATSADGGARPDGGEETDGGNTDGTPGDAGDGLGAAPESGCGCASSGGGAAGTLMGGLLLVAGLSRASRSRAPRRLRS